MDYGIITKAGLTLSDFAHLTGVSRVTTYKYVNDGVTPRENIGSQRPRLRVEATLKVLEKLVEAGKLPIRDLHTRGRPTAEARTRKQRVLTQIKALVLQRLEATQANM